MTTRLRPPSCLSIGRTGSRLAARRRSLRRSQSREPGGGLIGKARACRILAVAILPYLGSTSAGLAQIDNYGIWTGINTSPGQAIEFDTLTNATIGSIVAMGGLPQNAVFSPDGRFAYVVAAAGEVDVIDVISRNVVAIIPVTGSSFGLALSPDGASLYVTSHAGNSVTVVSTATNQVVGSPITVGAGPYGVAVSPDGARIYVANESGGNISIVDTASKAIIGTVTVGSSPSGITVSPDGGKIYVASQSGSFVSVIDAGSQSVVATIPVTAAPLSVAVSPDGSRLYVTTQTNQLVVINTATDTVIAGVTLPGSSAGVTVTPDGSRVYVTSGAAVYVLDTTTNTIVGTVSVPIADIGNVGTAFLGPNVIVAPGGALSVASDAALTTLGFGQYINFNGGTLRFTGAFSSARTVSLLAGGGTIDTNGFNATLSGQIINTGSLTKAGIGTLTLTGANTYTGGTFVNAGTLALSGIGTLGDVTGSTTVNSGGALDLGGTTQTQSAVSLNGGTLQNGGLNAPITSTGGILNGIGGTASLTTTAGLTVLLGTNGYTGATTVNGGVLDVEGTITGTSAVTVNAGGVLMGSGTIDPLAVTIAAGGTFAPGNGTPGSSMGIIGNLVLQSGAMYLVQINPATASYANVSGSATLGGATVNAVFATGSYIEKKYTILTTAGGVSGSFASTVASTNLPANFTTALSQDTDNAYLNLSLAFVSPPNSGLNGNQQAVANTLVNSFNTNGGIPLVYGGMTAAGLTQASGELGTSSQQTTFNAMGQFMGLLTDPFAARNGGPGSSGGAQGFAAEDGEPTAYAARRRTDAFAMVTKAPPQSFEQRWSVWATAFGGAQATVGGAVTGSNDTTSRIAGTAVGVDYLLSPNTLAGFALAGGGTSFNVANGLGSGRSDLFQAGAYLRHNNGPAYVSAALSYGWQDITTDRTVTVAGADRLRAEFNANAWSGRLEGGYRYVAPWIGGIGITPYGAVQFVTFDLPAYAEQVVAGSAAFALSYSAKSVTDTRSELGLRTDKSFAVPDGVLSLRGRLAWAHDFNPDHSIAATFQALPGASFVVNGAAQAHDSALTTAALEMRWSSGWSAAATFEGEFSNVTRSYAGKGSVRYAW
ncbi:autotransporter domain-containing protein [Bradyrhizobium sp. OK095]|uniref:autotransporter domain-containing protein n=1 Tax=Bradyrhizobium sp. OK095 TaxID=1882760 RepID=UPI0008CD69EE|nr:autotransporter domain-containing protein [Bradyrhizobium sp. OK095]SEN98362.1 40-residue YVTN family beta-propeller repeat-containing protein/autotransporter-associated beta strand repeat-containing protein [Bradyrhizobium sp. OK095]